MKTYGSSVNPHTAETNGRNQYNSQDQGVSALSARTKKLVFNDPQSEALVERVGQVAASDVTVLIIGETGTGKELIARHVHKQSGRTGPFLAVNCGALSESLVDAELFGHESGAFTGALQARAGWFEAANGGTLFLDEIGDMPQGMQVKLLRVLQERQVVRIGARRPVSIDVRLVAATNVDLTRAVEAGNFRKDLYYRINVVTLNLPRLCERQGDILPLTRNFMEVYRTKMHMPPISMTLRAEQALLCYSWPGNIRELENVIHYAVITCKLGLIDIDDLKLAHSIPVTVPVQPAEMSEVREESIKVGLDQLQTQFAKLFAQHPPELFSLVEKTLVRAAYDYCAENQVHTARLLGISRNVLRARLKSCGLLPDCTDAAGNRDVEPGTRNHLVLLPEQHLLLQKQHLVANTVALPTVRADIQLTDDTVLAA